MGDRWVGLVTRHRGIVIAGVTLVTLALAVPLTHMRLGLPADSASAPGTPQRIAGDLLTEGFGEGFNGQLVVATELPARSNLTASVAKIQTRLAKLDDVKSVAPAIVPGRSLAIINVTPSSGPSSKATEALVRTIRTDRQTITQGTGASIAVTGKTAINIDVAKKMQGALLPYISVIVLLA